ncbi:MAG: ABC-type spermidine/putrescine transport system, ATPase component [Herbinix sp.]|nr:ABC-type spermidine/putrescine transport system, ATPase component [Herbinix sp.]
MSVGITIKNAVKRYGQTTVIPKLSVDIDNGELFTLLGPSGCGKTTLLRMIAGFNSIEGGEFAFNGKIINDMEPGKRNIGMVFQNYAIFPNMTVRKNVEFGLKHQNKSKEEIRTETDKFLKLVHVDQYAERMPDRLSGGQQQRVALARALVIKVYVTHDQEEAMAISDRIAVMKDGLIRHCGTPQSIYQRPADLFVATFIGKSNLLKAKLVIVDDKCYLEFMNGYRTEFQNIRKEERRNREVTVSARPEELLVNLEKDSGVISGIKAVIKDSVFLGLNTHYFVILETGEEAEIIQESSIDFIISPGSHVVLTLNTRKANVFDTESELSLMEDVKSSVELPVSKVREGATK